ncbi:uncharacterized protein DEA37_0006710 [Paragonimus westermani]|uniref:Uncharacterized protein n=1 Tax=Paragonimus westermani TaxID=34504 RepID=A0A5J4NLN7_9TREM|nr:uncharacterized protein DEA37_0006710 [Paragonimus westermani]
MVHKGVGHCGSGFAFFLRDDDDDVKGDFTNRREFATAYIYGTPAELQLDTASDIVSISKRIQQLANNPIVQTAVNTARHAPGHTVLTTDELRCIISFQDMLIEGTCFLTNSLDVDLPVPD